MIKVNTNIRNLLIFTFLVFNVGCDQISKIIVREKLNYHENRSVIDHFITLNKVENTGAFLGFGDSLPRLFYVVLMIALPLIFLGYALFYVLKSKNLSRLSILGISFIIAGGVGNIIDRIIFGSVTDFMHFNFVIFQTGIVNMADISVTTGFFIILYELLINKRKIDFKLSGK
jgi:signal peptidase II